MRYATAKAALLAAFVSAACSDPALTPFLDLDAPEPISPKDGVCITATSNPSFSWSPVPRTRWYSVEVASDPDFTTIVREADDLQETSITFGDALPAGEYWWRVSATDGFGDFLGSEVQSFVVAAGLPPLSPELPAELGCGESPSISWDDPLGDREEITYCIEVTAHGGPDDGSVMVSRSDLTGSEHVIPPGSLDVGLAYSVRLRRVFLHCPGDWVDAGTFTVLGDLGTPSDLFADVYGCGPFDVVLGWEYEGELPPGAVFEVELVDEGGDALFFETTDTSLEIEILEAGLYTWRVRAIEDTDGDVSCASPWVDGEEIEIVGGPSAPEGLSSSWHGCGPFDATLGWLEPEEMPAGASFEVEIEGALGFSDSFETTETLVELMLPAADTYSWQVRVSVDGDDELSCASTFSEGPPLRTGSGRSWQKMTESAAFGPRESHGLVADESHETLFVIAGNAGDDVSDVWSSTDGTDWSLLTADAGFSPRRWFGSTWFDDRLWIAGGILGTGGANHDDVWFSYDGATWSEAEPSSSTHFAARHAPSLLAHDGRLWVIAGEGPNCNTRSDVWSSADGYDWEQVTADAGFTSRDWHGAVVFQDRMWIIGGLHRSAACSETYLSDVWSSADGVEWRLEAEDVFPARGGHATAVFDEKIWVIGGTNSWPAATQSDVWYSSDGVEWCRATDEHEFSNRYGLAAGVLDGRLFVIGGFDGNLQGDVWFSD